MKVLFAINDENIVSEITSRYQQKYKEIITSKSVYYFNAILKELQNEGDYDAIVIGEDLEPIADNNYDRIDRFILEKMDEVSDEASQQSGSDIPIILICSDRRTRNDPILAKLFSMSIYNAITGADRTIEQVCELISKPRGKKEAKAYYNMNRTEEYDPITGEDVSESEIQSILNHYTKIAGNEQKCVESFDIIASQYNPKQLKIIVNFLPMSVKSILEKYSVRYQQLFLLNNKTNKNEKKTGAELLTVDISNGQKLDQPVVIPATLSHPVTEFNNTNAYVNNNGINGQFMNNPYMNNGQMNQMQRPMQGNPYMNQYNQGNPYNRNIPNAYQSQRPMQPNVEQNNTMQRNPNMMNMQQGHQNMGPRPEPTQMGQMGQMPRNNNVQNPSMQFTNNPQNNQINNIQNPYNQFANMQNRNTQMNPMQVQNNQFANAQYGNRMPNVNQQNPANSIPSTNQQNLVNNIPNTNQQNLVNSMPDINQQNSNQENLNIDLEEQKKNLEMDAEPKTEQNTYQDIASVFDTPVIPDPEPIPTQEVPDFHLEETPIEEKQTEEEKNANTNFFQPTQMEQIKDEIQETNILNNNTPSNFFYNDENEKKIDEPNYLEKKETEEIGENEQDLAQEPKRGRGRPRKAPIEDVEDKPKRGRGRPRKIKPEDELNQTQTVIEPMENTQPAEDLNSFNSMYQIQTQENNFDQNKKLETIRIPDPVLSINPIQQHNSVEEIKKIEPVHTFNPIESVQTYNPVEEIKPVEPVQTFNPTEEIKPIEPVQAFKPIEPVQTYNPIEQIKPVEPVQTFNPIEPVQTHNPIETIPAWNNMNHEELNSMPSLGFEPIQDEYTPVVQNIEPPMVTIPTSNFENNSIQINQMPAIDTANDNYELPSIFGEVAEQPEYNQKDEETKNMFDTSVFNDNQAEIKMNQEQNVPSYDTSVDSFFGKEIAPISTNINQVEENAVNNPLETNTYKTEQNAYNNQEDLYQIQNARSPFENEVQQPTNINDILGNIPKPVGIQSQTQPEEVKQQENDGGFNPYNIPSPFENDMNVNNDLGTYANLVQQETYENSFMPNNFQNPQLYNQNEEYVEQPQSMLNMGSGKLCVFTGTSKNGVSFIVNNLAQMLIQSNVKVAILDETQNRNSFYIYTNNDEPLINKAVSSIRNLENGLAKGLDVSRYLTVYTNIPDGGLENKTEDIEAIVSTLTHNYDIILVDSDFETNEKFFAYASEIYVVQSMDALTIQPITKFLSELKDKGLLQEEKLRIIINKYMNMKRLPAEIVIEGLTRYNEPTMTLQKELFNSKNVPAILIPFDMQAYTRYMDVIATCQMTLNGYPTVFLNSLDKLASIIYGTAPELAKINTAAQNKSKKRGFFAGKLTGKKQKEEPEKPNKNTQYNEFNPNQYLMNNNLYSNEMNDTLNKMKKNY
ncbi:MAG: hypothetical protein HG450_001865 [Clostridiales bacterium]|nr:hypothetical protein [Clostridiales bacterium]